MPIAASEKAALPKTDIRAVHQALDAEHRTWAREDDSPQGSVKARLEQAWPDSLADGQLIKDDEGRDQLKAMPEAKRSSMFPDPWRTNPVGRFWDRLRGRDVTPRYLARLTKEEQESEQKWRTVGTIRRYILLILTLAQTVVATWYMKTILPYQGWAQQLKTNEENAYKLGAVKYVTLDVTQEYYEKSLKYMVFGNVLRNGTYPISVSSERIFQALAIARYANEIGADAIAHGSTGAGNDQIRFDMTFLVLAPNVEIITLTRDMALSRQEEIDYLNKHGFSADFTKLKYSYNVGLWGTSICGGEILDSAQGLPETAYLKHVEKEGSEQLRLTFEKGELKAVNDETFDDPIQAIQKVEEIGAAYGIGRDMHVGDTIIGIKGRVGFEAAAPMLIIGAHRFLEKYTLSKWQQYWKDQVANWYGMFLHESQYLEPVMRDIEAMLQESQRNVNGTAILELRPLSFSTVGVESEDDLVKTKFGEYGEMQKGWTAEDAKGFIKVTSTPLRVYYNNHKDEEI